LRLQARYAPAGSGATCTPGTSTSQAGRFKDKVVGGEKITQFGEFQIQKSVIIPQGEIFLLADPEFVGVMPVMYSLDVEENHTVEQFYKGWVMDEMLGMLCLTARGLARIVKADTLDAVYKGT
jgi:hypothetical protein